MTAIPFKQNQETYIESPAMFRFKAKDPISSLTHFIGFLLAILATPLLLMRASADGVTTTTMLSLSVFMLSMALLYGASASYHAFNVNPHVNMILKRIDHMSIFVLIAGSYTPICIGAVGGTIGRNLMILVWSIALLGIIFKFFWVTCPKWVSSVIYIGMGWVVISILPQLLTSLGVGGFAWLLAGGLIYTIGGVIYALKLNLIPKNTIGFGNHELFHLFVMAGTFCHFMVMFLYIA